MPDAAVRNSRPQLTVAMIVRDAERALRESLRSVADVADEIVVADTGSENDTRQTALRLATRVVDVPWQDDFSAARNACLAATRGRWILWLDAGETLAETTAREVRQFVDQRADTDQLYQFLIQTSAVAGDLAARQIAQVRLMPRRDDLRFEGRVRERLCDPRGITRLEVQRSDWIIQRSDHQQRPTARLLKARRNLALAELELDRGGKSPRWHLVRGEALAELGELDEARHCFLQARDGAKPGSDVLLEGFYGELTCLDDDHEGRETKLEICLQALEVFPTDLQLLCAMGSLLQQQQRLDLAGRAFQTAVDYGQINPNVWHLADIESIATVCLSAVLELQDKHDAARAVLEQALEQQPRSTRLRHHLIEMHVRRGRRQEALQQVARLPKTVPHREALANAVRGACLAAQQQWESAEAYLETAYDGNCRDPICLQWLAITRLNSGRLAESRQLLDEWRLRDPHSEEVVWLIGELRRRTAELQPDAAEPSNEPPTPRYLRIHPAAPQGHSPLPARKSDSARPETPSQQRPNAS